MPTGNRSIDVDGMVQLVVSQFPEQACVAEEMKDPGGRVIGHAFAAIAVSQPMIDCFADDKIRFETYCGLLEQLWRNGNDDVQNILDVTVLEELRDCEDSAVWKGMKEYISDEFKKYLG